MKEAVSPKLIIIAVYITRLYTHSQNFTKSSCVWMQELCQHDLEASIWMEKEAFPFFPLASCPYTDKTDGKWEGKGCYYPI